MNIPVVQLSLPQLSGQRGAEVARHCLEARHVPPAVSSLVIVLFLFIPCCLDWFLTYPTMNLLSQDASVQ